MDNLETSMDTIKGELSSRNISVTEYYNSGNQDGLRHFLESAGANKLLDCQELVDLAKTSKDAALFVKELISLNHVDETELADTIAKDIIQNIERFVDDHLEKYEKYTLNAPQMTSEGSRSKFFNLISLLKDVSILGRKLLEACPRFESFKTVASPQISLLNPSDKKSLILSIKSKDSKSQMSEDDATSDDLLAALIESSSSDDFLVLSSSLDSISTKDLMLTAMVLIVSHECFTLSHDIQGVVLVLRRTKFMIKNILVPKNQMELVAKLLTAISRYNEMNYVFDLFRDRNQFEMLLRKGVEKTPELRIALFNYVKKNPEFYALVTLNFSMFREIAESLEASANKRLDKLIQTHKNKHEKQKQKQKQRKKISLITTQAGSKQLSDSSDVAVICQPVGQSAGGPNNTPNSMRKSNSIATSLSNIGDGTAELVGTQTPTTTTKNAQDCNNKPLYSREGLNMCLVELVDASDCFAKADCYKRSNDCERKAKLIALQLALLSDEINVINLTQSQVADLIVSFETFLEAHLVAQAYNNHLTWRQALFRNVVLRGQARYLEEYCSKYSLSSALVLELVCLYKQYIGNANNQLNYEETNRLANSIKLIVSKLNDVELKCKLYNQLDFVDAKEELLLKDSVKAHLKDLKLA